MTIVLNPRYPGSQAVDEVRHAMDLIRVAFLAIRAHEADPSMVSACDINALGPVLNDAIDLLTPVHALLEREGTA